MGGEDVAVDALDPVLADVQVCLRFSARSTRVIRGDWASWASVARGQEQLLVKV
jgi:hypothetical protein